MDVNDKVKISFLADKELSGIIAGQKKYISEQTMAESVNEAAADKMNGAEDLNINGRNCRVSVEKVN